MAVEPGSWNPPGRSPRWRVGTLVAGLVCAGAGVSILLWPAILVWAVALVLLLLGLLLVASALLARGGAEAPPPGVFPPGEAPDVEGAPGGGA